MTLYSVPAWADLINVAPGQSIQNAINTASNGDVILVEPGTFTENINFQGKQITVKSTGGHEVTIIDGNSAGPVVTFDSWEQRETILEGFTIQNGVGKKIDGLDYGHGGGILCRGSSPTIKGNIIRDNQADNSTSGLFGLGGGICLIDGSYPVIDNNTIQDNQAELGGGIYIYKHLDPDQFGLPVILIRNSTITSNTAQLGGGIFICGKANPSFSNSTVSGSIAQVEGNEIYTCAGSGCTLITLSFFKAVPKPFLVIINWATESEIDNAGFNIYRSESEDGKYVKINAKLIPAKGSPVKGALYEFVDGGVKNTKTYYYKLEDVDLKGTSTLHGPVSATPRLIYFLDK
jgi:hypothetical protein